MLALTKLTAVQLCYDFAMIRGQRPSVQVLPQATVRVVKPFCPIDRRSITNFSILESISGSFDLEAEFLKRDDAEFDARCDVLAEKCRSV